MKTSSDAENPVEFLKILEKEKMKRLEKRREKKTANAFRQTVASCFCTSPSIYTFTRSPPFALDCSFHVFFAPLLSLALSLLLPGCLSPSQEKRPHHYQPGQATPGDMASNERKIHPAFSSAPLPLSASIYLSSLAALLHPLTPPTPSFLIRQIPRELEAISAAGTGVTCVCVCLCDLGACV